jgi:hypothetical protein
MPYHSPMPYREADRDKDGDYPHEVGCWIWTGYTTAKGHPHVRTPDSATTGARWMWQRHRKPLEKGQILNSDCGTRLCVNPTHHSAVTPKENAYRQGRTRLSEREALWAHRSAKHGMTQSQIAELFQVSQRTAGRLARGEYATMKRTNHAR